MGFDIDCMFEPFNMKILEVYWGVERGHHGSHNHGGGQSLHWGFTEISQHGTDKPLSVRNGDEKTSVLTVTFC